jgi:UDP-N-acetylmuramoylalanine--D-glutamate ligase
MTNKVKPKRFEYASYKADFKNKKISFNYKMEFADRKPLFFTEEIFLPSVPDLKKIPKKLLKNILENLHLMLGISYYKTYCPPKVKFKYQLSKEQADFWNTVHRAGLGEFRFRNKISSNKIAKFHYSAKAKQAAIKFKRRNRHLVGIGGGKDSIIAAELLKEQKENITAFVVEPKKENESELIANVIKEAKVPQFKTQRRLDEKLFQNLPGSHNGHIPISGIIAFLGVLNAILYDYSNIIVANEHSSNFGNLEWKGETINHQWSKSSEFEKLFQDYIKNFITPDIKYFSILRQFSELRIAKLFSQYKNYFSIFSSCNKNFQIQHQQESLWCGQCPKCAFTFLILSAFLPKQKLLDIFKKNLFEDQNLLPLFNDILGFGEMKPFDCVGTFEEAQAALYLTKDKFKDSLIVKTFLPLITNPEELVKNSLKTNPALNTPAKFLFSGIETVALIGYGKEGKATEEYIKAGWPKIKIEILDKKTGGENYLGKQENFDLAIKTPGTTPLSQIKIPHVSATNIFFSEISNFTIGVTGSKGKSTTASLIYEIIKSAGRPCRLLGNIGSPMLSALKNITREEILIIEFSNYQLEDMQYSPDIAVVTNLFPEHMDYHGTAENYYQAKKNIINFQSAGNWFVYNQKSARLKKWAKKSKSRKIPFVQKLPLKDSDIPLIGAHNKEDIKAAISAAKILKIQNITIKKAIKNFKPLPHRLEFVGEFLGIKFYDDANAAIPESAIAAIKSLPKIGTIFLGGEDRGYDFSDLEKTIKRYKIKNVVLFPDSGERMFRTKNNLNIFKTRSMEEAVKFAYVNTGKGSICLLSTASPSYSLWRNFEEKGDQFQYFVKKYGNKQS